MPIIEPPNPHAHVLQLVADAERRAHTTTTSSDDLRADVLLLAAEIRRLVAAPQAGE